DTTAAQAVAVNSATGAYSFSGVGQGTYTVILDNNNTLTDVTPSIPSGYISTEGSNGQRTGLVVTTSSLTNVNLGLYHGSRIQGSVFKDTGAVANDGIQSGSEAGLSGITVRATNGAGTLTYDSAVTNADGDYTLFLPSTVAGQSVRIVEANPSAYRSSGASLGNSGGTYDVTTDAISFTLVSGTLYSNLDFGDVPQSVFERDYNLPITPGGSVSFAHVFTAGTAGTVQFLATNTSAPVNNDWSHVVYLDANGNGLVDANETPITSTISVTSGQVVKIVIREFAPTSAKSGAQDTLTVTATLDATGIVLPNEVLTRTDVAIVSAANGLDLLKAVSSPTAISGTELLYTITYRNTGSTPITSLVISDQTPAFTRLDSEADAAAYGITPVGLTNGTLTRPPANGRGALKWAFTGSLAPGAQGTVTFRVVVD
ncbi:MAG TPA: hypothetical protein VF719_07285, partial [Abditibacteriaceae bacterium]